MAEHAVQPGKRKAQHLLASEVLELVHGPASAARTREEHQALRNPSVAPLSIGPGDASTPRTTVPSSLVIGQPISRILYHAGVVTTKSEGTRLVTKGGVSIATTSTGGPRSNDGASTVADRDAAGQLLWDRIQDQQPDLVTKYLLHGKMLMFRIGQWKVRYVDVVEDADFDAEGLHAPGWEEFKAAREKQRAA